MTWGQPCLEVDNSALTKTESMIYNEQARNNYPDPESFTEHWQFRRASQYSAPILQPSTFQIVFLYLIRHKIRHYHVKYKY